MFYYFDQNNSGGGFDLRAEAIIIEARSAREANAAAQMVGAYFDGIQDGDYVDCECCGDRWYAFDEGQNYGVYATLDEVLSMRKHHFDYFNDFAIIVPMSNEMYRLAENPNAPRCKATTKKGEQCRNSVANCGVH